ncbi:single-stranded-DNA-specific exonuclease RecJ [Thorsellia kenyensis]|uniref:Single-stranded-DNA-specific exonuclease RecJ n=1 Tax=Thorsellia kenyensis TaxID=1549888 RepID=A0ABV6C9J5_9GAMM
MANLHGVEHWANVDKNSILNDFIFSLYEARGDNSKTLLPLLTNIHSPNLLDSSELAASLLADAITNNFQIAVVGDFDADGATSTALAILALNAFGAKNVRYLIPSRFKDGYGLTPGLVDEAFRLGTKLILTVDNGVSAFDGIARAKELGIKVIVTDHHLPPDTLPEPDVIINPNLQTSHFPSKNLAGVGVCFYLMLSLRSFLRNIGYFDKNNIPEPNLASFLDLVALGTVADLVSLDENNRILVFHGLQRIKAGFCRPGIAALLQVAKKDMNRIDARDLGFTLGPRLNAAGRLDDMSVGVELLICNDPNQAIALAEELDALNESRKAIEQVMQSEALVQCQSILQDDLDNQYGVSLYHEEWHQGIIGLIASRIKEKIGRPVFAFAPSDEKDFLKGSGRSISGIHLRDILEAMQTKHPGLMEKFGGHAMAAGLTIKKAHFFLFKDIFNQILINSVDPSVFKEEIIIDGKLPKVLFDLDVAKKIKSAGPWGQGFNEPMFEGTFKVLNQKLLKDKHLKLVLEPITSTTDLLPGILIDAIAFNVDNTIWPDRSVHKIHSVFKLDINFYRGEENLQLLIEYLEPAK